MTLNYVLDAKDTLCAHEGANCKQAHHVIARKLSLSLVPLVWKALIGVVGLASNFGTPLLLDNTFVGGGGHTERNASI